MGQYPIIQMEKKNNYVFTQGIKRAAYSLTPQDRTSDKKYIGNINHIVEIVK